MCQGFAVLTMLAAGLPAISVAAPLPAVTLCVAVPAAPTTPWSPPRVALDPSAPHPRVACAPEELDRLRVALAGSGAAREVVEAVISRARRALNEPLVFPPRGGQHNQWYQCERCQLGLKTVDPTHHRCPRCKTVYSGEPYDDVLYAKQHGRNLAAMVDCAWAYAITGQRKYADRAAQTLLGYAARYRGYPYHDNRCVTGPKASRSGGHLFEQTLNEAAVLSGSIAPSYDLIHDSGVLSETDHRAVREGLILPMLDNLGKHRAGKSNWQSWHNAAMMAAGGALGRVDWIQRAIDDPGNGFAFQMEASVTDDGMWYENSWGYHFYTLSALVETAESARRLGIDLWSHPRLRSMFAVVADYRMPDGSLPRFGDDVQTRLTSAARHVEAAWHAYRDPAIQPLLSEKPTWQSVLLGRTPEDSRELPPAGSKLFPAAGHAILRGAQPAELVAVMTFGPYAGFHGHYDKLSFVLYGLGRELGVDPGRAASQAYRLPIHRDWYKATLSHNTVLVDGRSQQPASGKIESFDAQSNVAVARCDEAYPGVAHRRLLAVAPRYLLVVDRLESSEPHEYTWLYHHRADGVECPAVSRNATSPTGPVLVGGDQVAGQATTMPGIEYVQNLETGSTAEPIDVIFTSAGDTCHVSIAGGTETLVRLGDGPFTSVLDRVPLVMLGRRGRNTTFAVAVEPVRKNASREVRGVEYRDEGGGLRVVVHRTGADDVYQLDGAGRVTVQRHAAGTRPRGPAR